MLKYYREVGISTFPFVIVYRIYKQRKLIRIFSVFHTNQNPGKKYRQTQ